MFDLRIPLDGWLCVWSCGYEANAKLIENPDEAVAYFTEDIGFSDEDIRDILHLKEGESWAVNGLQIFKMNRRIEIDEMTQLKDMFGELSEATDYFGPEEIDLFTYEHGYYTCKSELGMSIDQDGGYDQERFDQIIKIFNDFKEQQDRR